MDCLFNWDHFYPLRGEPEGKHFEALTVLGAMAEVTERVELGSLVICNAYRNPDYLADAHRTIDHISGGRAILGIGAGWFEKDFNEYGYDFGTVGTPHDRLEEALPRIERRMGRLNPPPLRDPIPILIGGGGVKRTLKLVARHANIWHSFGTPDVVREKSEILAEHCANGGPRPGRDRGLLGRPERRLGRAARRRRDALHPRRVRQRHGLRPRPAGRARRVEGRAVIVDESTAFGARVAEHLRDRDRGLDDDRDARGRPAADAGVVPVGGRRVGGDVQQGGPARPQPRGEPERVTQLRRRRARRRDRRALRPRHRRPRGPPANEVPAYIEKYADHIERIAHTPESFGRPTWCRCGSS